MGRELKRVRLDFNWPIRKIWHGYLNPFYKKHSHECAACEGRGDSPEGRHLEQLWYGRVPFNPRDKGSEPLTKEHSKVRAFAERQVDRSPEYYGMGEMAIQREAQRLADLWNGQWKHHLSQEEVDIIFHGKWGFPDLTHEIVIGKGEWQVKEGITGPPTAKEVNDFYLTSHFSRPELYTIYRHILKKGQHKERCSVCKGEGVIWDSPEHKKLARRWKKFEPPKGDGYQLWRTTGEGEPMSPVFATLDELCEWCASNATTFAGEMTSKEGWKQMLDDGLVAHQEGNMVFI